MHPLISLQKSALKTQCAVFRTSLRRREQAIVARLGVSSGVLSNAANRFTPLCSSPAIALLLCRCRAQVRTCAPTDSRASGGSE
jgi:hypothetical protein